MFFSLHPAMCLAISKARAVFPIAGRLASTTKDPFTKFAFSVFISRPPFVSEISITHHMEHKRDIKQPRMLRNESSWVICLCNNPNFEMLRPPGVVVDSHKITLQFVLQYSSIQFRRVSAFCLRVANSINTKIMLQKHTCSFVMCSCVILALSQKHPSVSSHPNSVPEGFLVVA